MTADERKDRIVKHELLGDKIVNYVLNYFYWGYKGITVDRINFEVTKIKLQYPLYWEEEEKKEYYLPDDIGTGGVYITKGSYPELERMIKEYQQEKVEIEKLEGNISYVPDYIKRLIDIGLVYPPDGRKVVKKLSDVAEYLVDVLKMDITWVFLKKTFLQDDGSEWSDGLVTLALKKGNALRKEES